MKSYSLTIRVRVKVASNASILETRMHFPSFGRIVLVVPVCGSALFGVTPPQSLCLPFRNREGTISNKGTGEDKVLRALCKSPRNNCREASSIKEIAKTVFCTSNPDLFQRNKDFILYSAHFSSRNILLLIIFIAFLNNDVKIWRLSEKVSTTEPSENIMHRKVAVCTPTLRVSLPPLSCLSYPALSLHLRFSCWRGDQ